jgi:predicted PurR-regulated permease PerM
MILVGGITTAILFALGIESALLLGLIAGLLEFIPLFGPILSAVPAIGVALADSPQKALYVALAFVVIQQLEGNLITPLLLKRRVDIPPALTIIGIALMGVIFGFLGLLIAEPLIAALLVTVKMVYVEDVVGDEVISSS